MTAYAFIVGCCHEWPEQRHDIGDIGLARCLRSEYCNLVPKEQLAELYDKDATRANILSALEGLLDRRNDANHKDDAAAAAASDDTLLFYYGGHGKPNKFCTGQEYTKHSDIIHLLEDKFKGGTVWCIIDCCYSGTFGQAIMQRHCDTTTSNDTVPSLASVNYGCIMTVPPNDVAGMEWTITECFIRAFKGELRCFDNSSSLTSTSSDDLSTPRHDYCYYLSLKNGLHLNNKNEDDDNTSTTNTTEYYGYMDTTNKNIGSHPTWAQVIDFLVDEMVRIKGDRVTNLFWGSKFTNDGNNALLHMPCLFGTLNTTSHSSPEAFSGATDVQASIPRNKTWMEPFQCHQLQMNSRVFVKCTVGDFPYTTVDNSLTFVGPRLGWFPGRVIQVGTTTVDIELCDAVIQERWTITFPFNGESHITLGGLPFGFDFDPLSCARVIAYMAQKLVYLDTSIPPGTFVLYNATVICRSEIPWNEFATFDMKGISGPCVPVRWDDDQSISFVSTHSWISNNTKISFQQTEQVMLSELSLMDSGVIIRTPMDAMRASLACNGKRLNGNVPICGGLKEAEELYCWEAYDAEDCKWRKVQIMNQVDISSLPLQVLAFHMCYYESEMFSVVYWEMDSTLSIIPNSYIRRRKDRSDEDDRSDDDDSSDDDSSSSGSIDKDAAAVRRYLANLRLD